MSVNDTMRQEIANNASRELLQRLSTLEAKVDTMMDMLTAMQSKPVKVVGSKKKSEAA